MVDDQLSRMNDVKIEELPFNDYFHDDRVIAFLRVEESRYAHLIEYFVKDKCCSFWIS